MTNTTRTDRYNNATTYLDALYGDATLFEHNGILHPVIFHRASASQYNNIDSVCGRLDTGQLLHENLSIYNHAYLNTIQNTGRNVYDGATFAFQRLRHKPLRIDAICGSYFDMLATCAALDHELMDAAETPFVRLPLRRQYHQQHDPIQSLAHGKGRSAAIGGAVLIVFKHDSDYHCMLIKRSAKNATDPGFYHLIPAFIFQPATYPAKEYEWRFSYHVWRELLEELFGVPEDILTTDETAVMQHTEVMAIKAMMGRGDAGLYFTGVAMNLMTLRPEICGLLLIHDESWYERVQHHINISAESDHDIVLLPVHDDAAVLDALPPDVHAMMPPQATAALQMGLALARMKIQVYQSLQ